MKLLDLMSTITYTMSKMIPKKKNRWVFGAWYGTAVSDNTKAFYDYINSNYPDIEKTTINQIVGKEIVNIPFLGLVLEFLQSKIASVLSIIFLILIFLYNRYMYTKKKEKKKKKSKIERDVI